MNDPIKNETPEVNESAEQDDVCAGETENADTDGAEGIDANPEETAKSPPTSSTLARHSPSAAVKLDLDERYEQFDDNRMVITITFAPNKINPADPQVMLALQVAGDVVVLRAGKQSTLGALPVPVQTLLDQARADWPGRYAEAVQAKQTEQAKRVVASKTKTSKAVVKAKDIAAPPPPLAVSAATVTPASPLKKSAPAVSTTATLFDFTD